MTSPSRGPGSSKQCAYLNQLSLGAARKRGPLKVVTWLDWLSEIPTEARNIVRPSTNVCYVVLWDTVPTQRS